MAIMNERIQKYGNAQKVHFNHKKRLCCYSYGLLELVCGWLDVYVASVSEKELADLRGENRRNMMLSVALLAISALFYYAFIY